MKTNKKISTALFSIVFIAALFSQENTVSPEWQKIYPSGFGGGAFITDIEKDQFDNIYFGGNIDGGPSQSWNTYVGKINPQGELLWSAAFNSPANDIDRLRAITVDAAGNLYAAIESRHSNGPYRTVIIKYNSSGVTQWEKFIFTDSTGGYSIPLDIAVYQGDIFVAGQVQGTLNTYGAGWVLLKLDPNGNQTGINIYYRDNCWCFRSEAVPVEMVINPNNGDIFLGGWSTNVGGIGRYETIKYNTSCVMQWRRDYSYQGPSFIGTNEITAIDYDNGGNVIVTGYCEVLNASNDWITIKYNSSGVQQWVHRKSAPGNADDRPKDLITDGPGNIYVAGFITDVADRNVHTMKINGAGTMLWEQSYNSPTNSTDEAKALTLGPNNEVFVAATIGPFIGGSTVDVGLLKYNTNGQQQYFKRYDRLGHEQAVDIAVYQLSGKSNIYIGSSSENISTTYEMSVVKWSGPGANVSLNINGPGNYNFNVGGISTAINLSLSQVSGIGSITSNLFRNFSINNQFSGTPPNYLSNYRWLIEQNGLSNINGTLNIVLSQLQNHGISNGNAISIFKRAIDGSGAFTQLATTFANGILSAPINGFSEFILGSDTDPILVQVQTTEIPKEFSLHQNYPNPFNPLTKIRFEIAKSSQTKLVIYDITGREVGALFNEYLMPGTYSINFDGINLSTGTYFYNLSGEGFSITKKMILVK